MNTEKQQEIRCRFAPSPTGSLHVGGARTALFNALFAAHHKGTLVIRVEDSDRERSTPEALETILKGLEWLKIIPDEGPYYQSERVSLYEEYARKLLESGYAYSCTCSAERLDTLREEQKKNNQTPHYDGLHRPDEPTPQPLTLPTGNEAQPFVIRLRTPRQGFSVFEDLILGEVKTPLDAIDDFIIVRSDGTPTFNFVNVVDDIEMRMSHVIRGNDHISNTPKQLLVYDALQADPPQFAHIPMILGPDKKKLSKRHGATSVFEYKSQGYLSDAFVNYIVRLGWSHGDKEIFSRHELEELFSLENVGKSPSVFDADKLLWVNAEHIKSCPTEELALQIIEVLEQEGFSVQGLLDDPQFAKLIESLRERAKTIPEFAQACHWYLHTDESFTIDEKAAKKHLRPVIKAPLQALVEKLEQAESFTESTLEPMFHQVIEDFEIKLGKIAQPVRVAITGVSASPPIYDVLEILGRNTAVRRIKQAIEEIADPEDT